MLDAFHPRPSSLPLMPPMALDRVQLSVFCAQTPLSIFGEFTPTFMVSSRVLRPVQNGKESTGRLTELVGDRALLQLEIERGADQLLRRLEQLFDQREFHRR